MNITVNFHGDIYATFHGCPGAPCENFNDRVYEDEIDESFEDRGYEDEMDEGFDGAFNMNFDEDFDDEYEEDAPEDTGADTAPGVIVCAIDGLPECIPPELVATIADAAVAAFMEHIAGTGEVIPE